MENKVPYPELADLNAPVKDYDVIFLGFPIWWGTSPKIVNQFVKSYDLIEPPEYRDGLMN